VRTQTFLFGIFAGKRLLRRPKSKLNSDLESLFNKFGGLYGWICLFRGVCTGDVLLREQ